MLQSYYYLNLRQRMFRDYLIIRNNYYIILLIIIVLFFVLIFFRNFWIYLCLYCVLYYLLIDYIFLVFDFILLGCFKLDNFDSFMDFRKKAHYIFVEFLFVDLWKNISFFFNEILLDFFFNFPNKLKLIRKYLFTLDYYKVLHYYSFIRSFFYKIKFGLKRYQIKKSIRLFGDFYIIFITIS